MKNMTLEHLADVCHGTYIGSEEDKKKEIAGAVIDSRLVEKDYLFIAVRGEKVDGHSFIPSVFEKGALAVLSEKKLENPAGAYILVESTLTAMKEIAADYRRQLGNKSGRYYRKCRKDQHEGDDRFCAGAEIQCVKDCRQSE